MLAEQVQHPLVDGTSKFGRCRHVQSCLAPAITNVRVADLTPNQKNKTKPLACFELIWAGVTNGLNTRTHIIEIGKAMETISVACTQCKPTQHKLKQAN